MKLVLIDGNAIMHRAYHALPPMADKNGNQTHAIYGFISMLLKIVSDLTPTHLIVCFDRPEPTFRKTMYVGYQAKRPKMDDELVGQIDKIKAVVSAMDIPIYELAGYEADDVMGSLAFQAQNIQISKYPNNQMNQKSNEAMKQSNNESTDEVVIITGDRDILQLVNDTVHVYMPIQGLTNAKMYGEKEVEEKFGVKPIQIIDYKALAGDNSDNYPGVRGIGPKTASELLQKFGTIEGIYKAIRLKDSKTQGIKENTVKALSECAEDCAMAKKLATIVTDAPVTIDVEKAKIHDLNTLEAQQELDELGFKSLSKRLSNNQISKGSNDQKSKKINKQKEDNGQLSLI